jgi:hypothetical protein
VGALERAIHDRLLRHDARTPAGSPSPGSGRPGTSSPANAAFRTPSIGSGGNRRQASDSGH